MSSPSCLSDDESSPSPSSFEQHYRCYPISDYTQNYENGDKIVLPQSALDRLSRLQVQYPMMFELRNPISDKPTHCGVVEFSSEEGLALLPTWMMFKMCLDPGMIAVVKNVSLVSGTYVKLQPHTSDFMRIPDPKSALETALRSYSCLTAGDTMMIVCAGKKFYIDVLETRPCSSAISIIETDCEVEFATPLDYKRSKRTKAKKIEVDAAQGTRYFRLFTGVGRRLDGVPVISPTLSENSCASSAHATTTTCLGKRKLHAFGPSETAAEKSCKVPKKDEAFKVVKIEKKEAIRGFRPFTGRSYRLSEFRF